MLYLVRFAQWHVEFRLPELNSLLTLCGVDPEAAYDRDEAADVTTPFLRLRLPSEADVRTILSRSVLVREIGELWGQGLTAEECAASSQRLVPAEILASSCAEDASWSMKVTSHASKLSAAEQNAVREVMCDGLGLRGPVQLRGAKSEFLAVQEASILDASVVRGWHLMRVVGEGQRRLVQDYSLKGRPYLGPTSMDTNLAFLMANQALARPGAAVLDPFVGTGSVLVAAAHFGALCFGADIDWRILLGKGGRTLFDNFSAYGLPRPEVLRWDLAHLPITPSARWDAILCDPPYGIRAGGRTSGHPERVRLRLQGRGRREGTLVRPLQPYDAAEMYADLLDFAAHALRPGGRLVFWMAALCEIEREELPSHPCLRLQSASVQALHDVYARYLVTMVKVREPTAEERGPAREAARATFDGILRSLRKRVFEAYEDREGQPRVFRRNKNGVIRPAEALAAPVHAVREAGEAGGGDGDGRCGEEASPAEEARS